MIRVLVVDDSAVLRQSTRFILESDPELKVIGEASNGAEAVSQVERLGPDVITMDIGMPRMDGFEAIREIMAEHPLPIIVVTSMDLDREQEVASHITRLGAVSILNRPSGIASTGYKLFCSKLVDQVKLMSSVRVIRRIRTMQGATPPSVTMLERRVNPPSPTLAGVSAAATRLIVIGASTGGPAALHQILSQLPENFGLPIMVVQHISFGFVEGLASWLDSACKLRVQVGKQSERLTPGTVYIAPDNYHMQVDRFNKIVLSATDPVAGHRPAVTALFQSVAQFYGASALGVILTGMGSDGALGMKALSLTGAMTLAQDQASCVVFGMPKEAIALGAIRHILPLDQIAEKIQELVVA